MANLFKKMISLFLPVYNEEKILEDNTNKVIDALKKLKCMYEVIIVDDSSTDNIPKIAQKLVKNNKNIKYIRFDNGPSRRENLAKSFNIAKGDIIVFIDTDLAVDLEALPNLIKNINEYDIVIGSRYIKGAKTQRKFYRGIISFIYYVLLKILFNTKIKDHQCGFKAFKKDIILNLINDMCYDKTFKRGWFWDAEMLIRAQHNNYKICEIPVIWVYGEKSAFKFSREFKVLSYMMKFKKKWMKINTNVSISNQI